MARTAMKVLETIVGRLGIIKNQLLVFSIVGSIIMFYFASDLVASDFEDVRTHGFRLYYSATSLIFFGAGFYTYAFFRLPSSMQEIVFEEQGRYAINHHRERKAAAKSQKGPGKSD